MKPKSIASTLIAAFVFIIVSFSAPTALSRDKDPEQAALQDRAQAMASAPIKTQADLENWMKMTPSESSPLSKLSESGRKEFLESLTFNEKGLTGFSYRPLKAELSFNEIVNVLSLFGVQSSSTLIKAPSDKQTLLGAAKESEKPFTSYNPQDPYGLQGKGATPSEDHGGYLCAGRGTCAKAEEHICMSGC